MKADITLGAYRRHLRTCPFFGPGGRNVRLNKCSCPFHVDGLHHGTRVRDSLGTRNQQVAEKKVADLIRSMDEEYLAKLAGGTSSTRAREVPNIAEAIDLFLGSFGNIDKTGKAQGDLKYSSWRKYRNSLHHLADFCRRKGIQLLERLETSELEQYRRERVVATSLAITPDTGRRPISQRTWKTELQSFRMFFGYCMRKKWISSNCAKEMKGPRNLTPNEVVPYTTEDEIRILAACDQIGRGRYIRSDSVYERLRAKAMILILRHTALRVSDVVTLRKDAISWESESWRVRVRTTKTGEAVHLPIPQDLKDALDALPLPRNALRTAPIISGTASALSGRWWASPSAPCRQCLRSREYPRRTHIDTGIRLLPSFWGTEHRTNWLPTSSGTPRKSSGNTTVSGPRGDRTTSTAR